MNAQCPRCGSWKTEGPARVLVTPSGMVGSRAALGWGLTGFLFGVAGIGATLFAPMSDSTRSIDFLFSLGVMALGIWGLVRYSIVRRGKVEYSYHCKNCENYWRVG